MLDTPLLKLPYLAAAQAQKHVTVNDALTRLDALAQIKAVSRTVDVPATANDGDSYLVPVNASGAWAGWDGCLAVFSNGGWFKCDPLDGWVLFVQDEAKGFLRVAGQWQALQTEPVSPFGAQTEDMIIEMAVTVGAGASFVTPLIIPSHALVSAVTARVSTTMNATGASWSLGVSGSTNRYGSGLGLGLNSYALGLSSAPVAYYADTPIVMTCDGGDFVDGEVRIAIHCKIFTPPSSI